VKVTFLLVNYAINYGSPERTNQILKKTFKNESGFNPISCQCRAYLPMPTSLVAAVESRTAKFIKNKLPSIVRNRVTIYVDEKPTFPKKLWRFKIIEFSDSYHS